MTSRVGMQLPHNLSKDNLAQRNKENERPTHETMLAVGGGTTNEPSPRPPPSVGNRNPLADGSMTGAVIEHEPPKKKKGELKETNVDRVTKRRLTEGEREQRGRERGERERERSNRGMCCMIA